MLVVVLIAGIVVTVFAIRQQKHEYKAYMKGQRELTRLYRQRLAARLRHVKTHQ